MECNICFQEHKGIVKCCVCNFYYCIECLSKISKVVLLRKRSKIISNYLRYECAQCRRENFVDINHLYLMIKMSLRKLGHMKFNYKDDDTKQLLFLRILNLNNNKESVRLLIDEI